MKLEYFLWALAFIGVVVSYAGGKIAKMITKDENAEQTLKMVLKSAGVVVAAGTVAILYLRGNLN